MLNISFHSKLNEAVKQNLAFCLTRKPNEEVIELWVQDHSSKNKVLMHSFDSKMEKWIADENPISIHQKEFDFESKLQFPKAKEFHPKTEQEYQELIQQTIEDIQNSELKKVVISRKKQVENFRISIFETYRNLLKNHPNALVFLWQNPNEETWIGATPELLLSQESNKVKTVSLAGTKLPEAEWTEKELEEQQIVTDFIVTNFRGLGNLEVKGPETIQAGKFHHLKTYISAEVSDNFSLKNLLKEMHPTPALCGMPKQDAFEYILQNEGYDREFYAGYIGIEQADSKQYFVNLRSAQIFEDKIWIYVGGGITAESNPEKEWMETELKSGTILNSLV